MHSVTDGRTDRPIDYNVMPIADHTAIQYDRLINEHSVCHAADFKRKCSSTVYIMLVESRIDINIFQVRTAG